MCLPGKKQIIATSITVAVHTIPRSMAFLYEYHCQVRGRRITDFTILRLPNASGDGQDTLDPFEWDGRGLSWNRM